MVVIERAGKRKDGFEGQLNISSDTSWKSKVCNNGMGNSIRLNSI